MCAVDRKTNADHRQFGHTDNRIERPCSGLYGNISFMFETGKQKSIKRGAPPRAPILFMLFVLIDQLF